MKTYPPIVALALLMSCATPKPTAPPPVEAQPSAAAADPAPAAPPAPAPHDTAVAEVKRLTALAEADPYLAPWQGPHGGVPPWDKLKVDAFPRAFELGIALTLAEIDAIAENPEAPTFDNTFVPLENSGRHQTRADILFSVMSSNLSTPEVQAVDKEWSPKMAAARDKVTFNEKLFARVSAVYGARDQLDPEKRRLVELRYERFLRAGARLSPADKAQVGKINEELAGLYA